MKNQGNFSVSKELWQTYLETDFKVFAENLFTMKAAAPTLSLQIEQNAESPQQSDDLA